MGGSDCAGICTPDAPCEPTGIDLPADDLDQNCDGTVACYVDGDDDGFGSSLVEESIYAATGGVSDIAGACNSSLSDGWADRGDDCNDLDASVNPEAIEVCDDGVDNDCNGLVDSADPAC
jgi:hypothetical protein